MLDRLEEKSQLTFGLGKLLGPLCDLIEHSERYNSQEEAEISARYCFEFPKYLHTFERFTKGQPGHDYAPQWHRLRQALFNIQQVMIGGQSLSEYLPNYVRDAQAAIDAVPVPPVSVILDSNSPFTTYCRLCELCEVDATESLLWIDPYMDQSIFRRYLSAVRKEAQITLVTCTPNGSGSRDRVRWNEFTDVSRLFANERGPDKYQVVIQPTLHDRWVVFDSKRIYALGGSVKDASQKDYFTISPVAATPENIQKTTQMILSGKEFFGPKVTEHP